MFNPVHITAASSASRTWAKKVTLVGWIENVRMGPELRLGGAARFYGTTQLVVDTEKG